MNVRLITGAVKSLPTTLAKRLIVKGKVQLVVTVPVIEYAIVNKPVETRHA